MSNITYKWTILSKDNGTGSMIVEYVPSSGATIALNITQPTEGVALNEHVAKFAPVLEWSRAANVSDVKVGATGKGTADIAANTVTPQLNGNWNEEYLRAMIYQVLEELKDSEV